MADEAATRELESHETTSKTKSARNAPSVDDLAQWMKEPCSLEWHDIGFSVKQRHILTSNSGTLNSGSLCALLGPSGSGKTSLLNILARRLRTRGKLTVTGQVLLNGEEMGQESARDIAFVLQEDILYATTTPREAILFSATLRLPADMPRAEKRARVEDLITDLKLTECADTMIGGPLMKGVSGGEKKRTAIAVELVKQPKLCFLDEPTSGLDSYAANSVVKSLRVLSQRGCCVLCTIHQPSSDTFHLFKQVLVLMRGGSQFFLGGIGDLSSSLASAGKPCPAEYNLADHVLYLLQEEPNETLLEMSKAISGGANATSKQPGAVATTGLTIRMPRKPGFMVQLLTVLNREGHNTIRNKPALIASVGVPFFLNLLFGVLFFQAGDTGTDDYTVRTHFGAVTQVAIGGMFGAAQGVLVKLPLVRGLFLREYAAGTYSAGAFFITFVVQQLIQGLVIALVTYLIAYWLMGLNGPFMLFVLTFWASAQAISGIAFLLGVAVSDVETATALSPLILVPQILFAGFFIESDQIPVWLRWAQWLCVLKYNINLYLIIEFGPNTRSDWPPVDRLEAARLLDSNDVDPDLWWVYLLALVIIFTFCLGLAIPILVQRAKV
mmetsp:Transcript_33388/g.64431  ORF Transcript_33388/g.64431 Transcript_33388/m.64431 type:complete len:611 (-) Transcript_33388:404-2236(-)